MAEDATLTDWMVAHARDHPDFNAIQHDGEVITYRELWDRVCRVANGLQKSGLKKGDVVGVQLPNTIEFIISFLAVTTCGGVVQMLHMPYQRAEREQLLSHSSAKFMICLSSFGEASPAKECMSLREKLENLQKIITVGDPVEGTQSFASLLQSDLISPLPNINADDPFLLLYTSGTTASPKGVPHNYRGFLGNASRSIAEFEFSYHDKLMSAAPFTHLYGLYVLHLALACGACNVLLPVFNPANFLTILQREKPTALYSAPAHFAPFVAAEKLTTDHLSSLQILCLSGAPVAPALAESIDELLVNGCVIQLWGMSELQAGSFGRPGDPLSTRLNSAGRPAPETLLRVVDENGQLLAHDEEGELQVKGPSVFEGYLNNDSENAAAFTDDRWFRTGDLAVIDRQGYMSLTGRTKEIINRGGIKYNPIDIEQLIMATGKFSSCAIIPYPDAILGEKACLCLCLNDGQTVALDDIIALLESKGVAKYKWPERLEVVDVMPLTPTKKVMRGILKKRII